VSVSTKSALTSAINAGLPGDQIQMAAGTYASGLTVSNKHGTASDSLTICGPATAIVSGALTITNASYLRLVGFTVKDGWIGVEARNLDHSRVSLAEITNVGFTGIKLYDGSSDNVVRGNWIHHTGRTQPQYGEGVYVGEGRVGQPTNYYIANTNLIEGNAFGPHVTAEHFDIKYGTQGNIVRGNTHDATGFTLIWTNGLVAALAIADGNNQRVEADTVTNLTFSDPNNWAVFRTYKGTGTVWTLNVIVAPASAKRAFDKDHAAGTIVKCDNVKPVGLPLGTTCTP
jgi:hypothetical protein